MELNTAEGKNIDMSRQNQNIQEYAKLTEKNYNLIEELDEQIFQNGHLNLKKKFDKSESNLAKMIET